MNILYAVSEAAPFVKTGGLGDVAGSLPKALCAKGEDARVILPLYGSVAEFWREQMTFCFHTNVQLSWRSQYCGVFQLKHEGVTYYFLDNEYYFGRSKVYGEPDDGERFGFFSRAVIEVLPRLNWRPDVINCNTGKPPQSHILRYELRSLSGIKTVSPSHIEYQGRFIEWCLGDVFGLPASFMKRHHPL